MSGGAIPESMYRSFVGVGQMHPIMKWHMSFRATTSLQWADQDHTGQQYSTVETHKAIAVVHNVCGCTP